MIKEQEAHVHKSKDDGRNCEGHRKNYEHQTLNCSYDIGNCRSETITLQ